MAQLAVAAQRHIARTSSERDEPGKLASEMFRVGVAVVGRNEDGFEVCRRPGANSAQQHEGGCFVRLGQDEETPAIAALNLLVAEPQVWLPLNHGEAWSVKRDDRQVPPVSLGPGGLARKCFSNSGLKPGEPENPAVRAEVAESSADESKSDSNEVRTHAAYRIRPDAGADPNQPDQERRCDQAKNRIDESSILDNRLPIP